MGCNMISHVARNIAYRTIRNRGTIGGSLAHADPAGDWPLALPTLDAKILVIGPNGERTVQASEFITGAFVSVLADNEIILAVEIPKISKDAHWGYWKFCRKIGEFPEASAAMLLDPERKLARLWVGALDGAPKPLDKLATNIAQRGSSSVNEVDIKLALDANVPEPNFGQRKLQVTAVHRTIRRGFS